MGRQQVEGLTAHLKPSPMTARTYLIRAGVAAGAVISLALAQWLPSEPLRWLGLTCYVVCLAMFVEALLGALVTRKQVTADLLVATVMLVTLLDGQPLSGAIVAWFISLSLAVSFGIIERTRRKIAALTRQRDRTVRVVRNDAVETLPVEQVQPGDVAVVPQGEMIPVDGLIVEGASMIDEAVITGEPFPVYKQRGDPVISGSLTLSAPLRVQAEKAGDKAFLYVMGAQIQESLQNKARIHRRADKIVQIFIPGVVLYGLLVLIVSGELSRMAAVVAIACPCAWALATPTAFAAAIGRLAGRGILARGGMPLELAGEADYVVLEQTGTVTLTQPTVAGITGVSLPEKEVLQIAASVEAGFTHPIANAIVAHAAAEGVRLRPVSDAAYFPGQGIKAKVEGHAVVLGAAEALERLGLMPPAEPELQGRATWVVVDGQVAGAIAIQDALRTYASGLGERLRALGIQQVTLATGDNQESEARRVAEIVRADACERNCRPQDKTALVQALKAKGTTVMVGDGINDATALAAADVGIALGHAQADLAIQSADIIVLRDEASSPLTVLQVGRKLHEVTRQNYLWALTFNLVGMAPATAGPISPPLAAVLHHISSVFVVANAARLARHHVIREVPARAAAGR